MKLRSTLPLIALLFILPLSLAAQDRLLISEIMAVNNRTLPAEDGKFYDWIEIFNAGTNTVDLAGWYLSASSTLWRFPATNLNANSYLVVFASGLNRRVSGRPLHTNFKLKNDGELLRLLRPDGTTVVSEYASYPQQVADVSYGYPVASTLVPLVTNGAAAKVLVPLNDQVEATWMRPEFNASAWVTATNGIGFETEAATAIPNTILANSVTEFSSTQGRSNWFYGYWEKKSDANGIYDPVNDFVAFPRGTGNTLSKTNYWNGSRWDWPSPANPPWTELTSTGGNPSGDNGDPLLAVHWAIRRYVSETNGPLRITGTLASYSTNGTCGDGIIGRIFVDGVEVFQRTLFGQSHGYSVVVNANLGSLIDFIIDPGAANDDQCDTATFTAVILPAGDAAVVADSLADWSDTGVQGQNNWYYGFFIKTNTSVTYASNRFAPFPSGTGPYSTGNYWDGTMWRWYEGDPPFDRIGQDFAQPSIGGGTSTTNSLEHWAIRRWISELTGSIAIDWHLAKKTLAGGGLTGRIYLNGVQKDTFTVTGPNFAGTNRTVAPFNVQAGDAIDFTIEPGTDGVGDVCFFNATIYGVTTLSNQFKTDIRTRMAGVNATALLRIPFTITNALDFSTLMLRVKYDDGFIAYLNGSPVASRNAPGSPRWNSAATAERPDAQAVQFEEFDLTRSGRELLRVGENMLAIQGLNSGSADADFLLAAELSAGLVTVDASRRNYFLLPTPGSVNGPGSSTLGPLITEARHTPLEPAVQENPVVSARILRTINPVSSVRLYYRVMFGSEVSATMFDDGQHGDGLAGDGVYGAVIPNTASVGQMIRYYIVAKDSTLTNATRDPLFADNFSSQYNGAVVANPALTNPLPVLHLFITPANLSQADNNDSARTPCSVYYLGEFYDNIGMNRHGQSSQGFPKKSYDLDFNSDHHFRWNPKEPRVTDINLLTTYPDKAHMRNLLAYETYRDAGSPYHFVAPIRVQTNGGFYGDWHMVENGGGDFLKRLGRDRDGALYKMYNSFASSGDTVIGINGTFAEKKTRKYEDNADLVALFNGVNGIGTNRNLYLYDNINVSEAVNSIAARIITGDVDCCHKNYYFYRDSDGTGEWESFPWDVDLSFGRNWSSSQSYWDDAVYPQNGLYIGNNNSFFALLFNTPATKQMYLRRVRTLMDELQQTNGTPANQLHYEQRIDELAPLLAPDAALDLTKWGTWGGGSTGVAINSAYWRTLPQSVEELKTNYLPRRRTWVFTQKMGGELPNAQPTNMIITFGPLDFNPLSGNQAEEYLQLNNTNSIAVDISGWKLAGAIEHTFQGGVVMPANSQMFVVPDKKAFRQRTRTPKGGMGLYVEGPYQGQLSARGETITLQDKSGRIVRTNTYVGAPTAAQNSLRITEIMYHPAQPPVGSLYIEEDFEFIELKNIGAAPLDLTGVRFVAGIEFSFTGAAVTNLAPGEYVLVVRNLTAFTSRYGNGFKIAGQYIGSLDNSGENLRLDDAVGEKVLDFSYNNAWYPITDGAGASLVIANENAPWYTWGLKASWRPSALDGGSPAGHDSTPQTIAPVLVNEVLTHTDPPDVDTIELFNPGPNAVNLGGWFISDDLTQPKKFRIPAGIMLGSSNYLVFTERDFNPMPGAATSFAFSSTDDEVYLFSGDGTNITGYLHGFKFGAAANGITFGRYLDSQGREQFVAQSANTLGTNNAYPLVGPVVISEIMYHPLDLGQGDNALDEYIELHNITTNTVALYDPLYRTNTWRLRQAVDFDFPTNRALPPGGYLLVVGFDPADAALLASFRNRYSLAESVRVLGPYDGNLNNAGDSLELYRPDTPNAGSVPYVLVEQIEYSDALPWPVAADGVGPSLQRIHAAEFGNDPVNWAAALSPGVAYGGTPPVLATQPAPQTVIAKRDASFTVAATGTAPLIYQWRFNDANIPGANSATLSLANVQSYQAGQYNVVVYNPAGSVQSSNAVLTVLIPPSILTQPASTNVKAGANFTLRVVASSTTPQIRYQWQFNGEDIAGATSSSYTVTGAQVVHGGDYRVVVSDSIATEISDTAHVTIMVDPTIIKHPQSQIVAVGETVNLEVAVTPEATLPVFYRLRRNGAVFDDSLLNQRAMSYTFTNIALSNSASYYYTITNLARFSSFLSYTAFVAVVQPPANLTVAAGADAAFTVVVGNPSSLSRPARINYQWQFNGLDLTNESIITKTTNAGVLLTTNTLRLPAVQAEQAGTYGVQITILTNIPIAPATFTATLNVSGGTRPDRDGDGMPDDWEMAHGLNPNVANGQQDADLDGMSNLSEYLAGTDPQDAQSFLKVELEWSLGGTVVMVRFGAVSNKTYSVLYQDRLHPQTNWNKLADVWAAPTNRTVRVLDPSPTAPARFYRLITPRKP